MGIVGIGDVLIILTYSIENFVGSRAKCTLFYLELKKIDILNHHHRSQSLLVIRKNLKDEILFYRNF
jgi:hypothetical protein